MLYIQVCHQFSCNCWSSSSFNSDKIPFPEVPPKMWPGEAADHDLMGTSGAERWVKCVPCGQDFGTLAWPELVDLFP